MPKRNSAFRNQKPGPMRLATPYSDKPLDKPRGWFVSRKCGCRLMFWTMTEFDFMARLEVDPTVVSFLAHPERVMLRDGPDWFAYVPSFKVHRQNGVTVVELSYNGAPRSEREEQLARLASEHYACRGCSFEEIASAQVKLPAADETVRPLLRYLANKPSAHQVQQVRDLVANGPQPLEVLVKAAKVRPGEVLAMVRRGELAIAPWESVSRSVLVGLPGGVQ